MLLASAGYQSNWVDILQTSFMRHAFLGGSLVALAAGMLGYFVVVRRHAFAAHALAHIGFPGATFAALVGIPVTLGLGAFCIAGGLAIALLGKEVDEREIATGTILAFATGLGSPIQLTRDPERAGRDEHPVREPPCHHGDAARRVRPRHRGRRGGAGRHCPAADIRVR